MGTGSLFSTPAHSFVNRPGWREFQTVVAGLRRECPPAIPVVAPGLDPLEFDRACHDEAWGCAYSRVWRAYLDVIREAA